MSPKEWPGQERPEGWHGYTDPLPVPPDAHERLHRGEISYNCSFWHHGAKCDAPMTCQCECHRALPQLATGKDKPSFLFVVDSPGSAQWLCRGEVPARGLRALGHEVEVAGVLTETDDGPLLGVDLETGVQTEPSDVVVCRLWTKPPSHEMILRARQAGQVVLFDIDDDIWHFPEWNPVGRAMREGAPNVKTADPETIMLNMAACDAVVASTPALGASVIEVLEREGCGTDVAVARPGVDPQDYRLPSYEERTHEGPVRVGWGGVWEYRGPDLQTIAAPLAKVLPAHGAILWTCGATQKTGDGLGFPKLAIELGFPPYVVRETNWRKLEEYPAWMAECDIAVIPQVDCQFNRARSCHSALQWAACGVPVVATRLPEYELLEAAGGCLTCGDGFEWEATLDALLHDREYRLICSRNAYEACRVFSPVEVARQYAHIVAGLLEVPEPA